LGHAAPLFHSLIAAAMDKKGVNRIDAKLEELSTGES
jgi:hypothetical protein